MPGDEGRSETGGSHSNPSTAAESHSRHLPVQQGNQFSKVPDDQVRGRTFECTRPYPVSYSTSQYTGVAAGKHIGIRITNHHRLYLGEPHVIHQFHDAHRVRLFLREAVAPIDERKVAGQLQSGKEVA